MKKTILFLVMAVALTTSTLFAQVPSYVPSNGLVGYWPFNGNANDESGNGNNGTVNGATLTADRFGNANNAYSFDGVDDFINLGGYVLNSPQEYTIDMWIKLNNSDFSYLFSQATNGEIQIQLDGSGNIKSWNKLTNGGSVSIGTTVPNFSEWHHITSVFNNNTKILQFVIDGQYFSTIIPNNVNIQSFVGPALLGRQSNLSENFYSGYLDDIGIWNRALTQQEITAMNNGVSYSDTCNNVSGSLTQGLVGYWPFCGNANDESGNANNGTVNGATLTTDRFGNSNSAYSFDGNADYIVIPNDNSLNPTSITFSFWALFNNGNCGVLSKSDATTTNNYGYSLIYNFQNQSTGLFTGWNTSGSCTYPTLNDGYTFGSASVIQNNLWQHIVVTIDSNGQCKQYVNGLLTHTYNHIPINTCNSNLSLLYLGRQWLGDPCWMNGKLDDIGIWNRALTQEEITNLYNVNQCVTNITVTDTLIINVGQLSFNDPVTWANNITIAPNPASSQININFNNITNLNGGTLKIINSLGQEVATTPITTSGTNSTMQLETWGGTGMYFVQIINPQGQIVDIKKIILQ
jgi:hypothetical protein